MVCEGDEENNIAEEYSLIASLFDPSEIRNTHDPWRLRLANRLHSLSGWAGNMRHISLTNVSQECSSKLDIEGSTVSANEIRW